MLFMQDPTKTKNIWIKELLGDLGLFFEYLSPIESRMPTIVIFYFTAQKPNISFNIILQALSCNVDSI